MLPVLVSDDASYLREFLIDHFNRNEMRDLVFDLGLKHESFPQSTIGEFAREIVEYFIRIKKPGCLVAAILKKRHQDAMVDLLVKLPPCRPMKKVQIILPRNLIENAANSIEKLAAIFGVSESELEIIGASEGSLRLLISLPEEAMEKLADSAIVEHQFEGKQILSITPFESLDLASQATWQLVARNWPYSLEGNSLIPAVTWQDALSEAKASQLDDELMLTLRESIWENVDFISKEAVSFRQRARTSQLMLTILITTTLIFCLALMLVSLFILLSQSGSTLLIAIGLAVIGLLGSVGILIYRPLDRQLDVFSKWLQVEAVFTSYSLEMKLNGTLLETDASVFARIDVINRIRETSERAIKSIHNIESTQKQQEVSKRGSNSDEMSQEEA